MLSLSVRQLVLILFLHVPALFQLQYQDKYRNGLEKSTHPSHSLPVPRELPHGQSDQQSLGGSDSLCVDSSWYQLLGRLGIKRPA